MVSREINDRLTLVGADKPMGQLLRRYWQPVGTVLELEEQPVQAVRILGENLTLYRSKSGEYGLVGERCPHRLVSLEYGIPDDRGLRCPYHGWLFSRSGKCLEMPYDDRVNPKSNYKERISVPAYPVEELGGLLFAYMGPQPAPLLPRWDVLLREGYDSVIQIHRLPCNWLQCMDNAADPMHFEYLHAELGNYTLERQGKQPAMVRRAHVKIDFDVFKYGIMKRRLLEGESEDVDDWTTGHPLLFPNILAVGGDDWPTLQYRVPIDDTNTLQFAFRTKKREPGAAPRPQSIVHTDLFDAHGKIIADNIPAQDMVAWVLQGEICDRTQENLAASDKGIILYRKMLLEELKKVESGKDPMGTIRQQSENEPMIEINRETIALDSFDSRYEMIFDKPELNTVE